MSHLDDWSAALVDAELTPTERDDALAHLAGCPQCQADVDVQRRVKARLSLPEPTTAPASLTARLLAIPHDAVPAGGAPSGRAADVVRRSAAASTRPAGARPWPVRGSGPVPARRRSPRRFAVRSLGAVSAVMALALLAGGEAPGQARSPVRTSVFEHTATTTQLPLNDMVADIVMISAR